MDELINLINKLISFKTETQNREEILKCLNYIKEYLGDKINTKIYQFEGQYCLFACNEQTKKYDLAFSGHIDVVPALEEQYTPKIIDGYLYGRGAIDMKSQVGCMLHVLKHYNGEKAICALITSDEEIGGFKGTPNLIKETNFDASVVFVPDAGYNFQLINSERGVLQLDIDVHGKSVHSSCANLGINAITRAVNLYNKICDELNKNGKDNQTINLAKVSTDNEVYNKVPDYANMLIDIRYNNKTPIDKVYKLLDNEYDVSYKIYAKADPFYTSEKNDYVQKYIRVCKEVLKKDIDVFECPAASDARFFSNIGIPAIMMNPDGKGMHGKLECCNISSLEKFVTIIKKYIEVI